MKKRILSVFGIFGLALALGSCDANVKVEITDNTKQEEKEDEKTDDKGTTKEAVAISAPTLEVNDKVVSWNVVSNAEACASNCANSAFCCAPTTESKIEFAVEANVEPAYEPCLNASMRSVSVTWWFAAAACEFKVAIAKP